MYYKLTNYLPYKVVPSFLSQSCQKVRLFFLILCNFKLNFTLLGKIILYALKYFCNGIHTKLLSTLLEKGWNRNEKKNSMPDIIKEDGVVDHGKEKGLRLWEMWAKFIRVTGV